MTKNGTFLARQKLLVSEHFQIQKLACQGEERKTPPTENTKYFLLAEFYAPRLDRRVFGFENAQKPKVSGVPKMFHFW
ncbi:MAG: hypothetical protein R6U32_03820, partial [Candidatus Woesearchaeota archaeon]